jgi:DNA polymerase-1
MASALWIDNLGDAEGVLQEFKAWFENPKVKKVWHNYGFDRHVMNNEGIDVKGFYADTMHMARLWDTSRNKATGGGEGYSLGSLSSELLEDGFGKVKMKEIFGKGKPRKDGTESSIKELPSIRDLQTLPEHRQKFIDYSVLDAIATCKLFWVRVRVRLRIVIEVTNLNPSLRILTLTLPLTIPLILTLTLTPTLTPGSIQ